ncbi:hypothetical protein [Novipirellula artificiosorum]|uniref:Uncharacterized protein n=1 Tax=Novipirellula artificiosorum TaxID=2528016 RepID=A0A5C6D355_9BACT|nr:hypothetical protein [Novipirellula artificiosorum]TWU31178.1 hypothetical protein Poly41_63690 [Novipirellula artificiosorum]
MTGRTTIFRQYGRRNASCDEPKDIIMVGAQSIAFDQPATVHFMAWDPDWNSDRIRVICDQMVDSLQSRRPSDFFVSSE